MVSSCLCSIEYPIPKPIAYSMALTPPLPTLTPSLGVNALMCLFAVEF